jgi:hypothetical protein
VRNPLYVASVVAITGQALLLSRPVLLGYAAGFLAVAFFLVHWIEDPALGRRFGQHFEDYRNQVPGWWPRLPRRRAEQTTKAAWGPELGGVQSGSRSLESSGRPASARIRWLIASVVPNVSHCAGSLPHRSCTRVNVLPRAASASSIAWARR